MSLTISKKKLKKTKQKTETGLLGPGPSSRVIQTKWHIFKKMLHSSIYMVTLDRWQRYSEDYWVKKACFGPLCKSCPRIIEKCLFCLLWIRIKSPYQCYKSSLSKIFLCLRIQICQPKINFWLINRLIAQIPQCTKPIYHNAPFWNRNMLENGASWVICLMHCGICEMDELFIILLKWFLKMTTSRRIVSHIGFKKWFRLIQLDQTTVINKHLCADSVWISTMFFIVKIALRYYHYRALKDMFQSLCKSKKEVSLGLIQTGAIKPRILLATHFVTTTCGTNLGRTGWQTVLITPS